jgi:hypothetical protein
MIDSSVTEELQKFKDAEKRLQPLKDRMDADFKVARGDQFEMPTSEGKWESVTWNRPKAEAWKMINILGTAELKLFIDVPSKASTSEKEKLSIMESIVNGFLYSYELVNDGIQDQPALQTLMAFYRVVRGWGSYRLIIDTDDEGEPFLDLAVWDTRNAIWIPGRNGTLKVDYQRYISKESAEEEFEGFNGQVGLDGMVAVHDIWDLGKPEKVDKKYDLNRIVKNAIICGGEYVKEPETVLVGEMALDRLPIRIKAGGTIPMIYDNTGDDYIKYVGESWIGNNRNIIEPINRALSYRLTRAGMEAKMPQVIYYDSKGGDKPPNFDKDPFVKNSIIFLDRAKGQELAPGLPISPGARINESLSDLLTMADQGGLNPIAFGEGDASMTALGVDLLNRNTNQHILPFHDGLKGDFVWMAHEICKQFKAGNFESAKFKGYDSKRNPFNVSGKPADILEDQKFKCDLVIDELRDRATHSGMAIQEVKEKLISKREALEIHQLSNDPDRTLELIDRETYEQSMETPLISGILDMIKDYAKKPSKENEFKLNVAIKKLGLFLQQYEPQPAEETGGAPPSNTSTLAASRPSANLAASNVRPPAGGV